MPELVSYWNFDQGKDDQAWDMSSNGNHITLKAGIASSDWTVSGLSLSNNVTYALCRSEAPHDFVTITY